MPDKNDWRLQGQEDYLMDAKLYYVRFEPYSEEWEHEHCEFCWEKFSQDGEFLKEGYCTASKNARGAYWICPNCFEDFKSMFNWSVE